MLAPRAALLLLLLLPTVTTARADVHTETRTLTPSCTVASEGGDRTCVYTVGPLPAGTGTGARILDHLLCSPALYNGTRVASTLCRDHLHP